MRFDRVHSAGAGLKSGLGAAAVAAVWASPALADELANCADPMTQLDMNICAHEAWERADADLNLAYGMAIDRAREIDADALEWNSQRRVGTAETDAVTTEEMLRRAQRAWITYRDAACLVESDLARGGSLQPMLYAGCREDLTLQRTESLRFFGELN
ncbi:MAG: lysozyme inhibitor LprI family protein [Pseudomonadota bacterium]